MRVASVLAAASAYCVGLAFGQQYAGDVIPNSLPTVPGAEIAYFKIADPSGKNQNLTLINYYSHGVDTSKRINESQIQRAVVFIHGLNRDPGTYMSNMLSALSQVTSDPNVNFNTVSIMAPYFPNGDDKNYGYPFVSGLKPGRGSNTSCLVWQGSQWVSGGNTQYPYYNPGVSSYTVLDQIIQYYDNATLFPNLHQIVIAGHSAGGQTVQRYVAIGNTLNTKIKITYYIANPNSFAWFSTDRPFSTASCSIYDVYREGYTNFTQYPMTYGTSLVAQGRSAILANYNSRAINYARGTLDTGDDSSTCAPFTTGKDRNERFFEFIKPFPPSCSSPTATNCDTVDLVPVGHDAGEMMAAPAGLARLFLDNFYGNGNKSYDFGYPREQVGDDPYPNPAFVNTPLLTNANPSTVYAGGMTYYGCWSDQTPATLTNLTYQGTQNTIELCTSTCAAGGNTIAGLENNECFCGKALGYEAQQVVESSCNTPCPSNSSEICGGYTRLSIFSNGKPTVLTAPTTPATVGGYNYLACYTEATSGRALSSKSTSTSLMTLEYCANFCAGYEYFGTEYSLECYCGNSFAAGANVTSASDCSYTCANNATEYCGGSDRLTVYQNPNPVAVSSSATSSASTSTSTGVSCPASNGATYVSNGKNFTVECGIDHQAGDLTSVQVSGLQACIDACAQNGQCVDVSLSGSACYLKSSLGAAITNAGVNGAKLVTSSLAATSTASTTATTLATTTSAAAATSTASTVSCPASNGQTYVSNGEAFVIECGIDRVGGDLSSVSVSSFQQCIDACATTTGCVDVSLSGAACYMKSTLTAPVNNSGIYGARLASASLPSSSSSSSAPASTSTSAPVSCPASNSTIVVSNGVSFLIECGIDHQGGDMQSLQVSSLQQCIDTCATTTGCVDLSLSGSACYLKSTLGAAVYNGVYGAKVVTTSSSSSAAAATATGN